MKQTLTIIFVLSLIVGTAYAGVRENCGCGLGTTIMGQNEGLVFQVMAATTNGTSGNQTFGISSGTLGCKQATTLASNEQLDTFVADNMDNLATDIASGEGETLDAFAEIAQVPVTQRTELYVALQSNFDQIYPTAEVGHKEVVNSIVSIMKQI